MRLISPIDTCIELHMTTPNFLAFFFFNISEQAKAQKINHIGSNHKHKVGFQDIIYL